MSSPDFPPRFKKGNERLRHVRFLLHTLSIDQPRLLLSRAPTSCGLLRGVGSPTIQSSADQMESRLDVTKRQWHRGVEWISEENLPSSCALPSNQIPSELRHFWCPIGEVGDDQPRLPASDIFKQLLAEVLKELPRPPS